MKFCQILLALQLALTFFVMLNQDINGVQRKEKPPYGMIGATISIICIALLTFVYWKAGAFSMLLP